MMTGVPLMSRRSARGVAEADTAHGARAVPAAASLADALASLADAVASLTGTGNGTVTHPTATAPPPPAATRRHSNYARAKLTPTNPHQRRT